MPPSLRLLARHMLAADPPVHTRLRDKVNHAFTPRLVEALRPGIQATADQLLAPALASGRMELIEDYAFQLPIAVLAQLLGVPLADRDRFRDWSRVLVTHTASLSPQALAELVPMLDDLSAYMRDLFAEKRRGHEDDLTSLLLRDDDGPEPLNDEELTAMMLLLIVAGHETTTHLIGNATLALLHEPALTARLRAEPALWPRAIDELLRLEGPVETSTTRYTAEEVTYGGCTIPAGEQVLVVISSANRDAARFDDPDRLDLDRRGNRHVAFGAGIHYCLGASLARIEGEIALRTLFERAERIELAQTPDTLRWRIGPLVRGLEALPLRLTAQR